MGASVGKRVLMLIENAPYLLDSRVRPEATSLAAAGYQVSVICPGGLKQPMSETVDGVHIYCYPLIILGGGAVGYLFEYSYTLLATFILSWYVLRRRGFDLIHAHNPPDLFVLIAAAYRLLGKRFIYDQHDLAPEMFQALFGDRRRWLVKALIRFEQLSCKQADHVIVTNQSHQRTIMQRSGIPQERITVVRNGPKLDHLSQVEPEPTVRQPGKTVICYVGVMGYHDGIGYLLRAIHHLVNDLGRTDFSCILVGHGNAWQEMQKLSQQLQLNGYVHFTGWIAPEKVKHYIAAADICVAPEPSNPYNDRCTVIKIAEYMALGKPVVAFDLPEHRVTAHNAAVYARPNDEMDFAQKVLCLMNDPECRLEMGRIGRKRVATDLAWPHQLKHLFAAYESIGMRAAA
jgi:glycosyltransferase involved in cell wall biosynthesis